MRPSLHILFLASWYPHEEDPQGGIFIAHQAEALAEAYSVTVLWVGPDPQGRRIQVCEKVRKKGNLREVCVRYPAWYKGPGRIMAWKKAFGYIGQVHVVHLHALGGEHPLWELWLHTRSVPYLIHEYSSLYFRPYRSDAVWHASRRRLIRSAFRTLPVSQKLEEAMLQYNLKGTYTIVPNILCVSEQSRRKRRPNAFAMVSICRLVNKVKQVHKLLKALEDMPGPWRYDIIGDGPDRGLLEAQARAAFGDGSDREVRFLGRLEQTEVQQLLPAYHVCLIGSAYETFGLVALEALNAGVPVISPPVGVAPIYLNEGRNGILLEHPSLLPQCLKTLYELYDDLDQELLSPRQRHDLSGSRYCQRIEELYREMGLFAD